MTNAEHRLDAALSRLLAGQPARTTGKITVTNLCLEAGVGRDAFYRATPEFRQRFTAARDNAASHQPQVVELDQQLRQLRGDLAEQRRQHSRLVHTLQDQLQTYANQIQVLALRNATLEADNQQLRNRLERAAGNITHLPAHRTSPATRGPAQRDDPHAGQRPDPTAD